MKENQLNLSEKDLEIFFNTILKGTKPNKALKAAKEEYMKFLKNKASFKKSKK